MSARTVELAGGAPWGFRMHGGADQNQPLRISRRYSDSVERALNVNPGRKASLGGIREGDVITSINGRPTQGISNAEAHAMLRSAGPILALGLNEDRADSPRRSKGAELKRPSQLMSDMNGERAMPQAPVYATIRQPTHSLNRQNSAPVRSSLTSLPTSLHSTHLVKSVTSPEPVTIHPTNPFYSSIQGYSNPYSTTSRLPVPNGKPPSTLDRSRSLNSSRDHDDFSSQYEDVYKSSSFFTKPNHFGSSSFHQDAKETKTNGYDSKVLNAHTNDSKCDNLSLHENTDAANGLPDNKDKPNKNLDPFDTSQFSSDPFEKYFQSTNTTTPKCMNDTKYDTKEEIIKSSKITEHKISETKEVKTMKKIILNGDDSHVESNAIKNSSEWRLFNINAHENSKIDQKQSLHPIFNTTKKENYLASPKKEDTSARTSFFSPSSEENSSSFSAPAQADRPPQIVTSPPSTASSPLTPAQKENKPVWRPGAPSPPPPGPGRSPAGAPPPPPPPPPVWTPRSAGPSPQAGRKNFRPVHFEESPPVRRKFQSSQSQTNGCASDSPSLRSSQSAPAEGLNSLGSSGTRLPRAQSPTITLLQKAREGQLPRGSNYLSDDSRLPRDRAEPPRGHPVHALRREYASEGEERGGGGGGARTMAADDRPKLEGIGPTTKEGMPVALRSEVKDQSRWYKKMYDTIHKNKYDDDYVTVRYKSPQGSSQPPSRPSSNRSQYAYFDPRSGYLSEPEGPARSPGGAGSVGGRRRTTSAQDVLDDADVTSPYLPSNKYSTLASARASQEVYRNQPRRIEDYVPGKSSVLDVESRQWWDEVMDIFDGQLSSTTSLPQASPKEKKDLTSQILSKSNMARALKESGYESDSTLVFRRREAASPAPLSPAARRAAYRELQAGGAPPLAGFRAPAPPHNDDTEIEYIPISPTLTKIRVHKKTPRVHEVICYPVTSIERDTHKKFRKQAPSFLTVEVPRAISNPPAPPRRISSKKSRTLSLVTHNRPPSISPKRYASVSSQSNVDFLKDKISNKLSRQSTQILSKGVSPKTKMAAEKARKSRITSVSAPPSVDRKISDSVKSLARNSSDARSTASCSYASPRRTLTPTEYTNYTHTRYHNSPSSSIIIEGGAGRRTPISNILDKMTSLDKLWSAEKRNEPIDKAKAKASLSKTNANSTSKLSLSRLSPNVNSKPMSPRSLNRGRDMLRTSEKIQKIKSSSYTKSTPCIASPVNKLSPKNSSSQTLSPTMKSSALLNPRKQAQIRTATITDLKKKKPESVLLRSKSSSSSTLRSSLRNSKDAAKRESKKISKSKTSKKQSGSSNDSDISSQFGVDSKNINNPKPNSGKTRTISEKEIKATRDAVISDSFFQHLLLGGTASPIVMYPSLECDTSVLQKARMFQTYPQEYVSSKTVNSYLVNRKPVSQSRFKIWDRYPSPVRSPSPRSVSWPGRINKEVKRFDSLLKPDVFGSTSSLGTVRSRSEPPEKKMYFSQTSRPKSPTIIFHKKEKPKPEFKSPPKIIFSQTSRPVSPKIHYNTFPVKIVRNESVSPTRIIFSQTVRPISPIVTAKLTKKSKTSSAISEKIHAPVLYFSETSRPVSPKVIKKYSGSISRSNSASPVRELRSPSYRRINNVRNSKNFGVLRTRSAGDADTNTIHNISPVKTQSELNLPSYDPDYDEYLEHLQNESMTSERFRELNRYYSYLERVGELEKATSSCDLRHRKKDEEIIDFDRWKKIRAIERAEEELNRLYEKLRQAQNEKDFLFYPRDLNDFRWSYDKDRGLRIKEKSVEDLKDRFQQYPYYATSVDFELPAIKDNYKPLWRGTSVAETAFNINRKNETRSKNQRPAIAAVSQDTTLTELRKKIGIGNHLWSSLSIDQVNALKNQLNAIYSKELETKTSKDIDKFMVDVKDKEYTTTPQLHVRSNSLISTPSSPEPVKELTKSESIAAISCPITSVKELKNNVNKIQMSLSETEKRKISQTLSREVMNRVKKFESPPVPLQQELEAVEAKESNNEQKEGVSMESDRSNDSEPVQDSQNQFVVYPKDKQEVTRGLSSASETETGSSDISGRTVIYRGPKKEVQKKVEYFESVRNNAEPKIIYHAREDSDEKPNQKHPIDLESKVKYANIMQSQSCTDIKELFGESEQNKFMSLPPKPVQYSRSPSPLCDMHANRGRSPDTLRYSSAESVCRSRSESPSRERWRAWLTLARAGEVRRLARRFDSPAPLRRHTSDPQLNHGGLANWSSNERLNTKTGRKRNLPVARVPLRPGNRFMPHIDIISKLAALRRRTAPRSKSAEETPECRPGEVERIRRRFEVMSLLGQIYVSAPDMTELHDMAPYLAGSWIAHRYPKQSDNNKSLKDPSKLVRGRTSPVRREPVKPKPQKDSVKLSSILKTDCEIKEFDPSLHRPACRYEPPRAPPRPPPAAWPYRLAPYIMPSRHSVTFQESESAPQPPRRTTNGSLSDTESPRRYVESDVNIHYKCPVRRDPLPLVPERELARQQAEHMKRLYREQKRTKYLQDLNVDPTDIDAFDASIKELQDMQNRRHQDNFTPSQKNILPLNRYDEPTKAVARALYSFNGQTARELSFKKGDYISVRRQIDANWYEGELHGRIGLFPYNYVEILKGDAAPTLKRPSLIEGRARAKFDFTAQTNLELPLKKGEIVVLTRRIDHNWWEGRHGNKTGIFPDSYVQVLQEPSQSKPELCENNVSKPVASPASHGLVGGAARSSLGAHSYTPQHNSPALSNAPQPNAPLHLPGTTVKGSSGRVSASERGYGPPPGADINNTEPLYVDTNAEAVPYRAMYAYRPQNPDELELCAGDTVYVLERCDDGWFVGSSQRSGRIGTFPGNYVERI